jgi:hypothetical protein
MKCLYPNEIENKRIKDLRKNKKDFLLRFKKDGFYLIDSLEDPFEKKYSRAQKVRLLKLGQIALLNNIASLTNPETKIILIARSVFDANFSFLKSNNVNVINKEMIDFPGSSGQPKFREKFNRLLV